MNAELIPQNITNENGEMTMQKTLKIEGMMCAHCEAKVKKALEAIDGVREAQVDHSAGTAVVSLEAEVSETQLKEAVEAKKFKVLSIG